VSEEDAGAVDELAALLEDPAEDGLRKAFDADAYRVSPVVTSMSPAAQEPLEVALR
jgi:hypothetical protein